jgi:hypothetical protein
LIDLVSLNGQIRARATSLVPEILFDDVADVATDENFLRTCKAPALFVSLRRSEAAELVPGSRQQRQRLDVVVGLLVDSIGVTMTSALKGERALATLASKVMKALHWWTPDPRAMEMLKFRSEDEAVRIGGRLGVQLHFETRANETFN